MDNNIQYGYGVGFNDGGTKFTSGINEDVKFIKFELTDVNTPKYTGKALDLEWDKEGSIHRERRFPINVANIRAYEGETQAQAVQREFSNFNSWIKHIICNYVDEDAYTSSLEEAVATNKINSFETFVNFNKSFLPNNFKDITGRLILSYSGDFLKVPQRMNVTGIWWDVRNRKMTVSNKINLTPPAKVVVPGAGGDLPFGSEW